VVDFTAPSPGHHLVLRRVQETAATNVASAHVCNWINFKRYQIMDDDEDFMCLYMSIMLCPPSNSFLWIGMGTSFRTKVKQRGG
jgi:hypothetical protein